MPQKEVKQRIKVICGDITKVKADAIVNAANSSLAGGGGVDGAIHRAGGPSILRECMEIVKKHGRCNTGEAVITGGGDLPAKYVIHTVGPIWQGGTQHEEEMLSKCYLNSLLLAQKHHCKTVAFPNISTGVYGYPAEQAAEIVAQSLMDFLHNNTLPEEVVIVCFDERSFQIVNDVIIRQ